MIGNVGEGMGCWEGEVENKLTLQNWFELMTKQRPSLAMCCMVAIQEGRSSAFGAM